MGKLKLIVGLMALGLVAAVPARAELSADELLALNKSASVGEREFSAGFASAIYMGASWSQIVANQKIGSPRLFCAPEKMALTQEQVISILDDYVKSHPEQKKVPAGLVIVMAAIDVFPCSAGAK